MKYMEKTGVIEYTSKSLRWFGVALALTAALIWLANPSQVIIFLTPFTGSRQALTKSLLISGVGSMLAGYTLSRIATKC